MHKLFINFTIICVLLISCFPNSQLINGEYNKNIDGLNINYTIRGKGPVMLVGHPNSGKIGYELTLKPLEEKFTMVYYNSRGTGKSEAPSKIEYYKPTYLVEEIELLRKELDIDKIWLFGHSDQSAIALQYGLKYNQHVSGMLLSGTSWVGTKEQSVQRRKIAESKRISQSAWFAKVINDWDYMIEHKTTINANGEDISNAPLKWWTYNEESSQKVIPIVNEISRAGRRKPIQGEFYQESNDERNRYLEIQQHFKKINAKILIINGKFDTNNQPKYAQILQKNLKDADLILIDEAGHFPWIEQKEETFKDIFNWLEQNL